MSNRLEEERQTAEPRKNHSSISVTEAAIATPLEHDSAGALRNSVLCSVGTTDSGHSDAAAALEGNSFDVGSFHKRQQEDQFLAARYLLQRQRQDLLGGLLANAAATSTGLEQVAAIANQQLIRLRAMAAQQQSNSSAMVMASAVVANPTSSTRPSSDSGAAKHNNAGYKDDVSHLPYAPSLGGLGEENDEELSTNQDGTARAERFPQKLQRLIEEAEAENMQDVVSFFPHGRAFAIHKPHAFKYELMPKYFCSHRMSSFQRQLNLYGFRKITEGRDKGAYFHELFRKNRKDLCKKIKRKIKRGSSKPVALSVHQHREEYHLSQQHGGDGDGDGAFARLYGLQGPVDTVARAELQGFPGGAGGVPRQAPDRLQAAIKLFKIQMLSGGGSFNPNAGISSLGSLDNESTELTNLMNLRAEGQGVAPRAGLGGRGVGGAGGFGAGEGCTAGRDPATTMVLLEHKKMELLFSQMQQRQEAGFRGQHQHKDRLASDRSC